MGLVLKMKFQEHKVSRRRRRSGTGSSSVAACGELIAQLMFKLISNLTSLFLTLTLNLDPRSANWPLMSSPFPIISIIFSYVYFVKVMGPNYMKNKKPYQIEGLIIAYNILMVVLSAFFFFYVSIMRRPRLDHTHS